MQKIILSVMTCFVMFTSCSQLDDEPSVNPTAIDQNGAVANLLRTKEDAVKIALNAMKDEGLNVNIAQMSADVQVYNGAVESRSADTQSVYVINFDGGGFALVPAVDNGIDVYGMSDTGRFEVNPDDEDDLGSYILNMASNFTPAEPITPIGPLDTTDVMLAREIVNHNGHQCYYDSITTRRGAMGRYLLATAWGNGDPYSAYTPMNTQWQIHSAVGCVPVAMGQIMAFYKYPKSHVKGDVTYTYSWGAILSKPSYESGDDEALDAAQFLYSVAQECRMSWGPWVSTTYYDEPLSVFPKFGYMVSASDWKLYDYEEIKSQIDKRKPVYIDGRDAEVSSNGHAWVIDGYYHKRTKVTYTNVETGEVCDEKVVYDLPLVHCNWGWDGTNNGWYRTDIFPTDYGNYSGRRYMLVNLIPNR